MIKNQRHMEIMNYLSQSNFLTVENLAKLTNYSIPTIRRDLIVLAEQGYIIRNRGGAMLPTASAVSPLAYRMLLHKKQKQAMCSEAAKYIQDYMTIFIDEATTLLPIIPHLKKFKNLTIITNGLATCQQLNNLNINFYCTGGRVTNYNGFTGMLAANFVNKFNADIYFMASSSFFSNGTVADVGENEAYLKQIMIDKSKKVIYLCDKTKINKPASFNITSVDNIDVIITTANLDEFEFDKSKIIHVECNEED